MEMEQRGRKFQQDFEDLQTKLKAQKDQELKDLKEKYEKQIQELKQRAASDQEFLKSELERRIKTLQE